MGPLILRDASLSDSYKSVGDDFPVWQSFWGEGHFGGAVSAPPTRHRRFGAGQLGTVPFRRRTFRRRFLIFFNFSIYEEKTMKRVIS